MWGAWLRSCRPRSSMLTGPPAGPPLLQGCLQCAAAWLLYSHAKFQTQSSCQPHEQHQRVPAQVCTSRRMRSNPALQRPMTSTWIELQRWVMPGPPAERTASTAALSACRRKASSVKSCAKRARACTHVSAVSVHALSRSTRLAQQLSPCWGLAGRLGQSLCQRRPAARRHESPGM